MNTLPTNPSSSQRRRLPRAAALLGAALAVVLLVGWARAAMITIDDTTGADYDAILDGFPGLAFMDGEPDFGENALAVSLKAGVTEQRSVAEFPLPAVATAETLNSAAVVFNIDDVLATFGPGTDFNGRAAKHIYVDVFSADGNVEIADFKKSGGIRHTVDTTIFGTITDATLRQSGRRSFRVDVTEDVHELLLAGATHAGVIWRTDDSPTGTSIDNLGDGSGGPPGVGGSKMPALVLELADGTPTPTASPTPTAPPSSTSTRAATPTGTSTRTPRDTPTSPPATPTSTPPSTATLGLPTATVPFIRGDANCDGKLDHDDVERLQAMIFARHAPSCVQADANEDGEISAADVPAVVDLMAGVVSGE